MSEASQQSPGSWWRRRQREPGSPEAPVRGPGVHGRFKRSNSVTAAVQADLELEGFPGQVATEDKGLQFGNSFQRHSEPSTPTQYGALRTVRTQGLFSYREDYRAPADTAPLPPPEPWLEPALDSAESGRVSPCRRDGSWFLKLLHTETQRMEGWCKEMEREAEDNDLAEESKRSGGGRAPAGGSSGSRARREGRAPDVCNQGEPVPGTRLVSGQGNVAETSKARVLRGQVPRPVVHPRSHSHGPAPESGQQGLPPIL
ncbi:hypothetical protein QTO34_016459 [Cnephaeus nilssonii]|uniref:Uncharacterized protein n=1 Tax=Cnephaeus nilssonii TaxID=3371016 RepID=A0AA40I291_CNENI|nr:hypothetical protein QTO34_016459 [Eptesicus nilssonii]